MNLSIRRWVIVVTVVMLLGAMPAAAGSPFTDGRDSGDAERITVEELKQMLAKNQPVTIIDVRGSDYDASDSKIKGAIRVPHGDMVAHLKDIPRDRPVVTYCSCATDGGALSTAQMLRQNGFKNVRALKGGWPAWNEAGGPIEPKIQPGN